jgi:hypothetical protein
MNGNGPERFGEGKRKSGDSDEADRHSELIAITVPAIVIN